MADIRVPLNQEQSFSVNGGEKSFEFKTAQSNARFGDNFTHVRDIVIRLKATLHRTPGAAAFTAKDLPACVRVNFTRDAQRPSTVMVEDVPGELLQVYEELENAGVLRRRVPTSGSQALDAIGGGGSADDHDFVWDIVIPLAANDGADARIWPLAALERASLKVTLLDAATAFGDSHYSWTSPSVDVFLECVTYRNLHIGADVRLSKVVDSAKTTKKGITFAAGLYEVIAMHVRRMRNSGGDDLISKITSINSVDGGQPIVFPDMSPEEMQRRYALRTGGSYMLAAQSDYGLIASGKAVPLRFGVKHADPASQAFLAREDFKLNVVVGTELSDEMRFLCAKVYEPDAMEVAAIKRKLGVVTEKAGVQSRHRGPISSTADTVQHAKVIQPKQ